MRQTLVKFASKAQQFLLSHLGLYLFQAKPKVVLQLWLIPWVNRVEKFLQYLPQALGHRELHVFTYSHKPQVLGLFPCSTSTSFSNMMMMMMGVSDKLSGLGAASQRTCKSLCEKAPVAEGDGP